MESPPLSRVEPNRDPQRVAAEEVTSELCRAIKSQLVAPLPASSHPSTVWFSSHLTEMDAQLAAVQRIADSLEKDFSNTKMVPNIGVSHIDIFDTTCITCCLFCPVQLAKSSEKASVSPLNVKSAGAVKKTVRLALPREGAS